MVSDTCFKCVNAPPSETRKRLTHKCWVTKKLSWPRFKASWLLARLLLVWAVEEFFRKLHTFEIQKLRILFDHAVERHADLPWPREYRRVFDCRLIRHVVLIHSREPLDHMQLVA